MGGTVDLDGRFMVLEGRVERRTAIHDTTFDARMANSQNYRHFRVPLKVVGKRSSITFFVFGTLLVNF